MLPAIIFAALPLALAAAFKRASGDPLAFYNIHPNGNASKCVDLLGNTRQNGQPIFDCNNSTAQNWNIMRGQTKFVLAGTNFCLDATQQNPPNGIKMKIWECFVDLPQQDWFYTDDNRIALTNQGECLDLTNGNLTNFNPLQVWACTTGNTNQIWTTTIAGSM
ncbi:hypothetical protein EHS25_007329 [Saitozyma podzolica]|uniref:Ricin B lectin domain-containing protein n=1 Tax=Saitozyma podzolica TaxID=1890683 RepID=A0A427XMG8_9TREE|nr:hypothetical protein EHS25_007329 [Saitozyma podzolica]